MNIKTKLKSNYTSQIMVTFTPEQKKELEKYTRDRGLSMASFIRYEVLKELSKDNNGYEPKNNLAKFAGKLDKEEADKMILDIYKNRVNKQ